MVPAKLHCVRPDPSSDRLFLVLVGVVVAHFGILVSRLVYPDLNLAYPFMGGDGHDWIANGLRLAGYDVRYSGRPPLVPLFLAGLEKLGALRSFPVLIQAVAHAAVLLGYRVLRQLTNRRAAFIGALLVLVNSTWLRLSLDVMADVLAALLLAGATLCFVRAGETPRAYLVAGTLAGLAALSQQTALLLPLPLMATVGLFRRRDLSSPWLAWGGVAFALPVAAWFLTKRLVVSSFGDTAVQQWALLRLHLDAVPHYLLLTAGFASLPVLTLATVGVVSGWRDPEARARVFCLSATVATVAAFFVLCYDFWDARFVAHSFPLLACLAVEALGRVRRRAVLMTLGVAAIAWSAAPTWDVESAVPRVTLWPLPPVALRWAASRAPAGDARIDVASVSLDRRSLAALWDDSVYARVWRAHAAIGRVERPDPAAFATVRSAVYLFDESEGSNRYVTSNRLGNALGTRVKYLPATWFEPYRSFVRLTPMPPFDRYAPFRIALPGNSATYLVVVARGSFREAALRREVADHPRFPPEQGSSALVESEAIATRLGGCDQLVVIFPPPSSDATLLYLPFLLRSTELYLVADPDAERAAARVLGYVDGQASVRLGRASLRRAVAFGYSGWVIRFDR